MASKVNVKFVVILSSVLVAVFAGVAATLYFVLQTSPEEHAAACEAKLAEMELVVDDYYESLRASMSDRDVPDERRYPYVAALMDGSLEPTSLNVLRVLDEIERLGLSLPEADRGEAVLDEAMEIVQDAQKSISRAVAEAQGNPEYLEMWKRVLELRIPEDRAKLDKAFGDYRACIREIARARRTDIEAHERYHDFQFALYGVTRTPAIWERVVETVVDDSLSFFSRGGAFGEQPEEWHTLLGYSGTGFVRSLQGSEEWEERVAKLAEEHLEAALRADPGDTASLRSLLRLRELQIDQLGASSGEAGELASKIRDRVSAMAEANPEDPHAQLLLIESMLSEDLGRALGEPEELGDASALLDRLDRAVELLIAAGATRDSHLSVARVRALESELTRSVERPRTRRLVEALLPARPLDPSLLLHRAQLYYDVDDLTGAENTLERVRELPNLPVSIAANRAPYLKVQALTQQARLVFSRWESTKDADPEVADAAVRELEQLHQEMTERMPSDSPVLALGEAYVLFAKGDLPAAERVLEPLAESWTSPDTTPFEMLLDIAAQKENWTQAQRYLQEAIERAPNDPMLHVRLAQAFVQGEKLERALEIYEDLADRFPENEQIERRRKALAVQVGEETFGDPIRDALARAERLARGDELNPGNVPGAIELIEAAREEHGEDPGLSFALVQLHRMNEDQEAARAEFERAIAAFPDTERLRSLRPLFESESVLQAQIAQINANEDATEFQKAMARSNAYAQADNTERADEELAIAAELRPDHPMVIEKQFRKALRERDRAEAERLVQLAIDRDLDGVGGARFEALFAQAWGDEERAVSVLREAVENNPGRVELLMELGALEAKLGQLEQAEIHLEEAYNLRSSDLQVLELYTQLLVFRGRFDRALEVLRSNARRVTSSEVLRERLRILESETGNREAVIRAREREFARNPDDRDNAIKLARLYVQTSRWERARGLIDRLRQEEDSLPLAKINAEWHAAQGDMEGARTVFNQHIAKRSAAGELNAEPFLALADLLDSVGASVEALETLKSARRWDSPETMRVEKAIAGQLAELGRYEEAAETYRAIIEAGADDERGTYRKRLAAALADAGRIDESLETLEALADREDDDQSILLLKARIAMSDGRTTEAREFLDRGRRLFPNSADIYEQRAILSIRQAHELNNEQLYRDALVDLQAARELAPDDPDLFQLQGRVRLRLGEIEKAFEDFRNAATRDAGDIQLVSETLDQFLLRDRGSQAATLAQNLAELRPNDAELILACSRAFARHEQWDRARRFGAMAWEKVKNQETATGYARALLKVEPPSGARALEVLGALESGVVEQSPELLMLRAEGLFKIGQTQRGLSDVQRSARLAAETPTTLLAWYRRLEGMFDRREPILDIIRSLQDEPKLEGWITLFRANALAYDGGSLSEALPLYQQLTQSEDQPLIAHATYRHVSSLLLDRGEYERAAMVLREGADRFQRDWVLANNLAITLVDRLDRAAEAIAYAEQAVQARPDDANVLDTLGWAQARAGQIEKAIETLGRARDLGRGTRVEVPITLHLAWVQQERGAEEQAASLLEQVRELQRTGMRIEDDHAELLARLEAQLRSPS